MVVTTGIADDLVDQKKSQAPVIGAMLRISESDIKSTGKNSFMMIFYTSPVYIEKQDVL